MSCRLPIWNGDNALGKWISGFFFSRLAECFLCGRICWNILVNSVVLLWGKFTIRVQEHLAGGEGVYWEIPQCWHKWKGERLNIIDEYIKNAWKYSNRRKRGVLQPPGWLFLPQCPSSRWCWYTVGTTGASGLSSPRFQLIWRMSSTWTSNKWVLHMTSI